MHLHLVLPGLLWPHAQTANPAAGLAMPALERLLGLARVRWAAATQPERWLQRLFGLDPDTVSAATLRRLGEDPPVDTAASGWLCADPVNLHFAREHLILADAATLAITAHEAAALVGTLNEVFAELGRFEAPAPDRWYLLPHTPPRTRFVPLSEAVGRAVARCLPAGEDAGDWQRLANEIQVVLHNHPINRAREHAGQAPVNSLWLWGHGTAPNGAQAPLATVQADTVETRGLAKAAGLDPQPPSPVLTTPTLTVLETLARPALHLDLEGWRAALGALERDWFAPLLAALRAGRLRTLQISAPGERATLELQLSARDLWKFWLRPRSLDALHTTLH